MISGMDRVIPSHGGDHLVARLVVRRAENPQVKDALEAITKKSFGYNAAAWRRWWRSTQLAEIQADGEWKDEGGRMKDEADEACPPAADLFSSFILHPSSFILPINNASPAGRRVLLDRLRWPI